MNGWVLLVNVGKDTIPMDVMGWYILSQENLYFHIPSPGFLRNPLFEDVFHEGDIQMVVWVGGIPLWKGFSLVGTLGIPNHQPKPTINH